MSEPAPERVTRDSLHGRKTINAAHLYFGGGKGGWLYGIEGVPRLTVMQHNREGRSWHVDHKRVRDLDAAIAVLNGEMTLDEARKPIMAKISLDAQLEEVDYELKQRARVYPGLVQKGSYRQSEADLHVARMEAVRDTLLWLKTNEAVIKAKVEAPETQKAAPPAEAEGAE